MVIRMIGKENMKNVLRSLIISLAGILPISEAAISKERDCPCLRSGMATGIRKIKCIVRRLW